MNLLIGPNGIINRAKDSSEVTKRASAVEKVELILGDYSVEKYTGTKTLEEYLEEQKEQGNIDEVINNGDGSFTIEVDGYEVTIKEEDLSIIEVVKAGGIRPKFDVILTKTDGSTISTSEEETLTQKAMTINITNITEFGENYTIEVIDQAGNVLTKEENTITSVTGQASYIITKSGKYTIKVTGTKEEITKTTTKAVMIKLVMPEIEESAMFSKEYGVMDIIWLDTNNKVIPNPISPKEYLGGLTAVKYNGSTWVKADETNRSNDWYEYIAQTGNTDGKTSKWANAVANYEGADSEKAYFVWVPRYAYKITYFNNASNAAKYREDKSSTEGIVGYSNIEGMVDVVSGTPQLVKDSKPINVTGKVQTEDYADYIPHPAFEFEGAKSGMWVGKFESSGDTSKITIIPDVDSLKSVNLGNIMTACQRVKDTYHLKQDSHMMKNIEWGAVAYLTQSQYGRNGEEVTINSSNYITGGGDYKNNTIQSSTGNRYGIYDINGTSIEYVAGVCELSNGNYYNFTNIDKKYYDKYTSYSESKKIKGDAVYETSKSDWGSTSWHQDYSWFINLSNPVLERGR